MYFAMLFDEPKIRPPNPRIRPDILLIGKITLPLNLSIFSFSLTIVRPVFSKKFDL